jgi:hypothetical protein
MRLEYQDGVLDTGFTHLVGNQKARILVGEQYGWAAARSTAATQRLLQQTTVAIQTKKLFRIALT